MNDFMRSVCRALCFFAAGAFFLLLGFMLASPFTAFREVRDANGQLVNDSSGQPLYEFDRLTNYLAHWPENGSYLLGIALTASGLIVLVASLFRDRSVRKIMKTYKPNKACDATGDNVPR